MKELEQIRQWASSRGLYEEGDIKTQFVKLTEEVGELANGILKKNEDDVIDAIGDIVVVLTNLSYLANKYFDSDRPESYYEDVVGDGGSRLEVYNDDWITIEHCIEMAWDQIKDRKGKMVDGDFQKEG